MERKDIPVTVIGGYLGAGKTTALNRVLAGDHGLRLAVLVNDFGAINIDASLIAAHDDDTIALTNGCVCCSIADDLGTALKVQVARPDPPDHIMVEASGVADPAKMGRFSDGWPGCRLAQIMVVADISTVRTRAADKFVGSLVQRQLQAADRIVLNKGDLVSPDQAAETAHWVSAIAPDVPIAQTTQGGITLEFTHDMRRSGAGRAVTEAGAQTDNLRSFCWRPDRPVRIDALKAFFANHPQIHRAKGTILSTAALSANGERLLVNWSGGRADVSAAMAAGAGDALVLIGTFSQADEALLVAALDETLG